MVSLLKAHRRKMMTSRCHLMGKQNSVKRNERKKKNNKKIEYFTNCVCVLCVRWRVSYVRKRLNVALIRQPSQQQYALGSGGSSVCYSCARTTRRKNKIIFLCFVFPFFSIQFNSPHSPVLSHTHVHEHRAIRSLYLICPAMQNKYV